MRFVVPVGVASKELLALVLSLDRHDIDVLFIDDCTASAILGGSGVCSAQGGWGVPPHSSSASAHHGYAPGNWTWPCRSSFGAAAAASSSACISGFHDGR
eukprot:5722902-Pyramimonas_sp.AAC.1